MIAGRETALTTALVSRHIRNRHGGWDVGMLDIAQDYILCILAEAGIFDSGLIFKGGTALRKCRSGTRGRFSTDLDFSVNKPELIVEVFNLVHGRTCHGFGFELQDQNLETGRADLIVYPPFLENNRITADHLRVASKLEISARKTWLDTEHLEFVTSAVHIALNHKLPTVPVVCITEAVAEKLARYSRAPITRDLYDLWWYGKNTQLDESLIRSLWIKKVYVDLVIENRWKNRQFEPPSVLSESTLKSLRSEQIGLYYDDSEVVIWDNEFRSRYRFLTQLTEEDLRWVRCDPRDQYVLEQLIDNL